MPTVTDAMVRELARLARLELSADEARRSREALSASVALVEGLRAVDVAGVPPYRAAAGEVPLRADVPGPCLDAGQILGAAPASQDGRFVAARVRGVRSRATEPR